MRIGAVVDASDDHGMDCPGVWAAHGTGDPSQAAASSGASSATPGVGVMRGVGVARGVTVGVGAALNVGAGVASFVESGVTSADAGGVA